MKNTKKKAVLSSWITQTSTSSSRRGFVLNFRQVIVRETCDALLLTVKNSWELVKAHPHGQHHTKQRLATTLIEVFVPKRKKTAIMLMEKKIFAVLLKRFKN